jgi:hypothetical protein
VVHEEQRGQVDVVSVVKNVQADAVLSLGKSEPVFGKDLHASPRMMAAAGYPYYQYAWFFSGWYRSVKPFVCYADSAFRQNFFEGHASRADVSPDS